MTDRELLEAAAEAAGMTLGKAQDKRWFYCEHGQCGEGMYLIHGNLLEFWNPLADDGDAFRLAVKLRLSCRFYDNLIEVCQHHKAGARRVIDHDRDRSVDMESATRRAIVKAAAAALTPSMESKE